MDDILHDQNDINESTRAQLDAISTALGGAAGRRATTTTTPQNWIRAGLET